MKRICILLLAAAVLLSCTLPTLAEEDISQQAAYEQGQKLLAEGQYAGAAFLFSAMEHYQDSTEYYFYACARLYEELGQTENARAIYLVMPWFEDCAQRAAALRCGGLHIEHIDTADHAVDLFRKEKRLGKIVLRRHEPHAFAPRAHGGELAFRPVVMGNQGEGAAQYFRRGAVIFRETDLTCARMLRRKTVKASRARSAEAINRLIRVADEKHALPAAAPFLNQLVLDFVAVLKFIHEKMGEGRIKLQSVKQQVVKITHAVFPQPGAVALVGFRVRRRFDNAAFHLGNLLQKLPRGELQLHFL